MKKANLADIKEFANIIHTEWRAAKPGTTVEEVAAQLEASLDGSQPADLIEQATKLCKKRMA